MAKRVNARTVIFDKKPSFRSSAAIVGKKEGAGPLYEWFDLCGKDDTFGQSSF